MNQHQQLQSRPRERRRLMAGAPGAPVRPGQDKTQKLLLGACFFCPFFLLLLLLAVDGVAPFGDASLLFADAKGQYVSYFLFYRETLLHGGDLFYTFEKILGGSVSGLYAYYLASPFNLIFLLFPAEKLPLAFDWMVVLKLSCCGLTMGLFLRHRHPLTPFTLLFTTAYALCGYNNAFSWCTMWTDGVILLPLVALGIHHICEGERPWLYLFSLAAAILFCFYIGYMLCLFALLYFLYLTAVRTESLRTLNIRSVGRFALASLLAGALSAVLWVPGVLALRGGMSKSPLEEIQVYTYPACTWILSRLLPGREAGFYDRLVMPLLLGLAALSALLVCAAVWALYSRRARPALRNAIWALVLGLNVLWVLTVEQYVVREEMVLSGNTPLAKLLFGATNPLEVYGGSVNSYVGQALLLLALSYFLNRRIDGRERKASLLLGCVLLFSAFFYLPNLLWHGLKLNDCFYYRWSFICSFFLCMLADRSFEKREGIRGAALTVPIALVLAVFLYTLWRQPRFMERWQYPAVLGFGLLSALVFVLLQRGRRGSDAAFAAVELAALCLTMGLSIRYEAEYATPASEYLDTWVYGQEQIAPVKPAADDFYRIRKSGSYANYNDAMFFGYPGITHFSSAERVDNTRFMAAVGVFAGEGHQANGDLGMARAADTLLAVRYYLGSALPGYVQEAENRNRNPYALPFGHTLPLAALAPAEYGGNPFDNLEQIYAALGVEETLYRQVRCSTEFTEDGASLRIALEVESPDALYLYVPPLTVESMELRVDGELARRMGWAEANLKYLGSFEPGQELEVTVKAESGNILAGWKSALLAYENEAALADCYARLTADACETVLARSSHIVSTVTVDEEKALMLTMPQEKGWRVRIDGEPAQLQTALGFFPAVTLTPGTHQVEFRFVPPGLVYGLVCAGLALLAMLLWALWDKRRALNRNRHAVIGRANQEQIELHFQ